MSKNHWAFLGLCLGFFLVMMDATTVPLAYTTLMDVFNLSPAEVAWVNNSYLVMYAASLLLGGRLGDFANRKNVVLCAYLILGLGAWLSGSGQSLPAVLIGRVLMGIGAGLLTPQSMAYISQLFGSEGRGTALGVWGAVAGIATATGPVLTQVFLAMGDWRWIMWINIPVALVCLLLALVSLPSAPGRGLRGQDIAMSLLYGCSLAAAIIGLEWVVADAAQRNLGTGLLIGGLILGASLLRYELKGRHSLLLAPALWSDHCFLRTCLVSGVLGAGLTAFYLPLAFLLGVRMQLGPSAISAIMVTIALANALVGPLSASVATRLSLPKAVQLGLGLFALASLLIGASAIVLTQTALRVPVLMLLMALAGCGTGLAFAPLANMALSRAEAATIGRAAAFYNSVRQLASALGGVLVALLFDGAIRLQLGLEARLSAETLREQAPTIGLACALCFIAISMLLSLGVLLMRSPARAAQLQNEGV
ncbi:MFS transporter [Aeromonas popoffii]|uniref:MFS transporter n=1 Tax=Aeromonas popoffii TaxID=70856 RepID=UPI0005A86C2F|nr:MFS transporter [Aeromonas popoffii]